jgi:hypothetical protein
MPSMSDVPFYQHCPKCLHTPLPQEQSLPAACPACGLILAKYAAANEAIDADAVDEAEDTREVPLSGRIRNLLSHVPAQVDATSWWGRAVLLALFALWGMRLVWMDYRSGEIGSSFLHGPLLIFHEAGHVLFSPFGEFVMILGGTLAQLLMPAILGFALLWRNRDPFGAAVATWFLGASVLDIAPYAYDALDPQLVLLGGHTGEEGGHDWIYLLSETGLLQQAHGLGSAIHKLGALIVLGSIAWAVWILLRQWRRIS